jgi:transposase
MFFVHTINIMDATASSSRQLRGAALAKTSAKAFKHIAGETYFVPSQTNTGSGYVVDVSVGRCSCPDYETRGGPCKHVFAVRYFRHELELPDGSTVVTEGMRVSYPQSWSQYNAAQCEEKTRVQSLLKGLCEGVVTPPHPGRGPKPIPLSDAVYGMTMKVYTGFSGRRATSDIEACAAAGHVQKAPRYNTTFDYFGKPELTPLLTTLVEESAAPLACVETKFAADSTGFGTSNYKRWYDAKYGREMKQAEWLKAHAMIGTTTNVITAVRVTGAAANDCPELPPLLDATARRFNMAEVSADKAYLSRDNLAAIEATGAVPYIPFKSNSQGAGPAAWRRMWGLFMYRQSEFLSHYHQRSNVESTFSALKRKFGGAVRSKNETAQVNEVLCKALCFNLSMLVHAIHELGVEPNFPAAAVAS